MKNKNVIITGASSGIGFAIAREFARKNMNVFLLARNKEKLEKAMNQLKQEFPKIKVECHPVDISNKENIFNVINAIGNESGIDIIVNNAGIPVCGKLEDNSLKIHEQIVSVNYLGHLFTTHSALPFLKKSKGKVGFISSVAGYTGLIGYSGYAPAKFAISGLAECLRKEFKDYGISVTIGYPPDTQTPMLEYEHMHTLDECRALSKTAKILSAEAVAVKFVKSILENKFEVLFNFESRLVRILKGISPSLYFKIIDSIVDGDRKKRKQSEEVLKKATGKQFSLT